MSEKLYFRYGTMGSAKTAHLLTTAYNFEERRINFLCFKPAIDTRDEKGIIKSRIGIQRECIEVSKDDDLFSILKGYAASNAIEWVLVDEAQFLEPVQVDQLAKCVDMLSINVICYGLRTDFKSKAFPGSLRLLEIADTIEEIKSLCACGRKTIINARIDEDGNIVRDGEQVQIGGNGSYISLCRKCWNTYRNVCKLKEFIEDSPDI